MTCAGGRPPRTVLCCQLTGPHPRHSGVVIHSPEADRAAVGLLLLAFIVFVVLGMVDGSLGVAWPSMSAFFGRSLSDLGFLLVSGGAGYLTASLFYGWIHGRLGTGTVLWVGTALLVGGVASIAVTTVWQLLVLSPLLVGLGGGLVDTGMNAHAALAFDVRSMNLLHASFGVGATLGPVLITLSLTSTGVWRAGYAVLAVLQVVVGVAIWVSRHRWQADTAVAEVISVPVRRRRRSLLLILLFLLYTGVEFGAGQWAFTLLSEGRGLSTAVAGLWVSAYWGGLTLGRIGVGVVGHRWSAARTLNGGVLIALVGLAWLWADPAGWGAAGLPITGLGLAPIFPTLVTLTPQRIGRDRSTHSIGYQLAAATIGGSAIPWIIGLVGERGGFQALAGSIFLVCLLLAIVLLVSEREARVLSAGSA